mmetsp:Transcript_477/g.1155  ORF Transcript_477/g.1155 Transcript_477/m.1155 type:complete len:173 (-) Transcript_477:113-631(-)
MHSTHPDGGRGRDEQKGARMAVDEIVEAEVLEGVEDVDYLAEYIRLSNPREREFQPGRYGVGGSRHMAYDRHFPPRTIEDEFDDDEGYDPDEDLAREIEMMMRDLKRVSSVLAKRISSDLGHQLGLFLLSTFVSAIGYSFHKSFPYTIKRPKRTSTGYVQWFLNLFVEEIID